jgi:hypothetical protein
LKIIANGIRNGILNSYCPVPYALGYSPTTGTSEQKKWVIKYMKETDMAVVVSQSQNEVEEMKAGMVVERTEAFFDKITTNLFGLVHAEEFRIGISSSHIKNLLENLLCLLNEDKKSRNSNGGITASFPFSASLRWNYPNRFGGSPYPARAGQGLSAQ